MNEARAGIAKQRIGQVLRGKWHVDALLGVGGVAVVYAATHRNGKQVAVKMLHPELSADPDVRARFLREGYAANAIGHPGCVSVLDDDTAEDGSVFVVMELLEGETLDARAARLGGKLPPAEVMTLADQLLDVLAVAHDKGVVHRDLKPDNLFLTHDGRVKVLDFGLARLREAKTSKLTVDGAVMGTPAFMPPEQALAQWDRVDARSDLWAVGATLYTLLTGRLVHETDSITALLVAIATRPAAPIATLLPTIPPALAAVIDRALALDRAARFPDARSMKAALLAAVATSPALVPVALSVPVRSRQATREAQLPQRTAMFPAEEVANGTLGATTEAIPNRLRRSALPLVGAAVLLLGVGAAVLAFSGGNAGDGTNEKAAAVPPKVGPSGGAETGVASSPSGALPPAPSESALALPASVDKPNESPTKVAPTARTPSTAKTTKKRDALGTFN